MLKQDCKKMEEESGKLEEKKCWSKNKYVWVEKSEREINSIFK